MKPSSLPEKSAPSKAAQAAFPALAAHFFPSQRCCHNQNTLQGPQGRNPETNNEPGQACNRAFMPGHPLFCISRGGVSITEQPAAKTRSWLPVRTPRHEEIHQPSETRGLPQEKGGKGLPYKQQFPIQRGWGGKPLAQKPEPNSVRQSVVLCYSGAQRRHDKNKPRDKNTARAKTMWARSRNRCHRGIRSPYSRW